MAVSEQTEGWGSRDVWVFGWFFFLGGVPPPLGRVNEGDLNKSSVSQN